MYCSNCGKEIEEGSKFCKYCGLKVEESEIETRQKRAQEEKKAVSYYDTPKIIPRDRFKEGEMIVFETRPHKVCYLLPWWIVGITFFIIGLWVLLSASVIGGTISVIGGIILLIIALLFLGISYLSWKFTFYCLTAERVIKLKGILNKDFYENRLEKVQDLRLKEGVIQRMFGCGDILITTAGMAGVECVWGSTPNVREIHSILRAHLKE
ncbi:hypothetical protein ES703_78708 [subsurface metagenome]